MLKISDLKICPNNIFLTVFLILHLLHLALSMLFPLPENDPKSGLDVVARTSTAVLAGYFVSRNFVSKPFSNVAIQSNSRYKFQTIIVATIGLFSMCIMFTVRYVEFITVSYTTLTQLRDLYLASVAFLMGTSDK